MNNECLIYANKSYNREYKNKKLKFKVQHMSVRNLGMKVT